MDQDERHYSPLLEQYVDCDLLEVQFVKFKTERIRCGLVPAPEPALPTLRVFATEVVNLRMIKAGPKHRADVARMILNHWTELLDQPIDEITRRDVELGLGRLSQKLGSATVNRALSALSRVLRVAHEDGMLKRNVCTKLRLPEKSNVANALAVEQTRRLLAAAEPCYRPVFATMSTAPAERPTCSRCAGARCASSKG